MCKSGKLCLKQFLPGDPWGGLGKGAGLNSHLEIRKSVLQFLFCDFEQVLSLSVVWSLINTLGKLPKSYCSIKKPKDVLRMPRYYSSGILEQIRTIQGMSFCIHRCNI